MVNRRYNQLHLFRNQVDTALYLDVDSAGYKTRYYYTLVDSCKCNNPIVKIGTSDTIKACGKDTIQLNASSGFKSYQWSNSDSTQKAVISASGLVSVKAIDSFGCIAYDTALVSILNPKISPSDTLVCSSDTLKLETQNQYQYSNMQSCQGFRGELNQSLLGYWPFCGNANDLSINGYDGTSVGAILTKDQFDSSNSAYYFDGNSDYINVGNSISKKIDSSFTISLYFNSENLSGDHGLVSAMWSGTNPGYASVDLITANDKIRFGTDGFLFSKSISTGNWYHVVAIFDGAKKKKYLYIDGSLSDSSNSTVSSFKSINCRSRNRSTPTRSSFKLVLLKVKLMTLLFGIDHFLLLK